jgi:uncharacterized protein YcfJ
MNGMFWTTLWIFRGSHPQRYATLTSRATERTAAEAYSEVRRSKMRKRKDKKNRTAEEIAQQEEESGKRISGEPDSNLAAVGAGGIAGAATGAAIGTAVGGPVGAAIGAAAGGIAGAIGADKLQDEFDPNLEEVYWRENFTNAACYKPGDKYEEYLPAYRLGWEAAVHDKYANRNFNEIEPELQLQWKRQLGNLKDWALVRDLVHAGFERVRERQFATTHQ